MHISVLVPKGQAVLSSVVGAYKVFNAVNGIAMQQGKDPLFKIDLVGITKETTLYDGLFQMRPNKLLSDIDKTDLIIVTTIVGDFEHELALNAKFIPWIRKQHLEHGAEVASLCTGAFLLAETGLCNGKAATTHWQKQDEFRERYPQINLLSERVIVEDNGIYSSGGAFSFLNLLLYLVEKYAGKETAIFCAKLFEIDYGRNDQNQFAIFMGQKNHSDESIKKAQLFIEKNAQEKINVEKLAEKFAISRRNFVRRFKKATANTPLEYIQRVKIEIAKKNLESSTKNVSEVMYNVGYSDEKAFRNVFRKHTGLSPLEYRGRYNRVAN